VRAKRQRGREKIGCNPVFKWYETCCHDSAAIA
jgi:hypothetical protein